MTIKIDSADILYICVYINVNKIKIMIIIKKINKYTGGRPYSTRHQK